jgi:oxygen-independent coproporphyrinogen-3 oxidase
LIQSSLPEMPSTQPLTLPVPLPADVPPGLYVHIPFCRHICPYCDFNTYAGQERLIPDYVDALVAEMRMAAALTPQPPLPTLGEGEPGAERACSSFGSPSPKVGRGGWGVRAAAPTLFLGGGTPSLLSAEQVARVVDAARALFGLRADAEVTLEANPESLSAAWLRDVRAAGVNRLSIGVQSRQRAGLRVLGRGHTAAGADLALDLARGAGFANVSLDLIFGWPGQTPDDWEADLQAILRWNPEHVSLYSLIVEPGTPMHDAVRRGILSPPDDDTVAGFYERAVDVLGGAGWEHYEIANWARAPRYRSRHNQLYWQNGAYHGFGAGAHGTIGGVRSSNLLLPARYVAAVRAGTRPVAVTEQLAPETQMGETMMLGLRLLQDGVSPADFAVRHGIGLRDCYASQIARFSDLGLLEWQGDRLRLTPRGALLANEVCAAFLV